eukprot:Tamp_03469.p1 GENE.Tamp_03469~~Tamp_03469.p1  ORF type:complete len:901 (-),score=134.32 Tamp_03469:1009-3624(-)
MEPAQVPAVVPLGSVRELAMAEHESGETAEPQPNGGTFTNLSEGAQAPAVVLPADGAADIAETPTASDSAGATTVFVLVLATFFAFALYLLLFSEIGFGATLFKTLMRGARLYVPVAGLGFILVVVFYIVDFDTGFRSANSAIFALIACCMVFAAVLCFSTMPHAPLMAFMVTATAYYTAIYTSFWKGRLSPEGFLHALSKACVIGGVAGFVAASVWAGINNCWWGTDCKRTFRERLRVCKDMTIDNGYCERYGSFGTTCSNSTLCEEKKMKALSACDPEKEHCLAAFMLWASPFLMSVLMVLFGVAMHLIATSTIESHSQGLPGAGLSRQLKMFGQTIVFLLLLLWIGASIAGASMQLANVLISFSFLGMVMLSGLMAVALGGKEALKTIKELSVIKKVTEDPFWSDMAKAFGLCVGGPMFVVILPISWLKRTVRKCRSSPTASTGDVEAGGSQGRVFTEVAAFRILQNAKSWRWTSVLRKAWLLSFGYFAMQAIVTTMVTLFLAWLNMQLQSTHVLVICLIIMGIGLVLFAIPVVPGVPAYLACGVIIGAAQDQVGGFWMAQLLGIFVAGLTKHLACLLQQKVFGELLGKSLWVRSTLGVNQPIMKAIHLILQEKGLTMGKVAILVGGPDWPTSVLTGVLRCSAFQMQIGTAPVLVPIACIVLTGGAMLQTGKHPDSIWVPLSAILLTVSGILQVTIGVMAVKYTNLCQKERADEIAAMPDDEEVKKFDEEQQASLAAAEAASQWDQQSTAWRAVIITSTFCIIVSAWIFKLCDCFQEVVLTTNLNEAPFHGKLLNVFKMWGWIGLVFQVVSWVLYYMFKKHIDMMVRGSQKLSRVANDSSEQAAEGPQQAAAAVSAANAGVGVGVAGL